MKRIMLIIPMTLLCLASLCAYTDSFSTMNNDPLFLAMLDVVKNGGSPEDAEEAYAAYMAQDISETERSRAEYHMVRYYKDMGNDDMAWEHLGREQKAYESIDESTSEVERLTAQADMVSAEYYITGKMGTGMESSYLMKDLYNKYPDEFYTSIQEAFRLLYTPPIAGGSHKKALKIINAVEADMDGISRLDTYSLLMAKAMALSKSKEWEESDEYLDRATSIYTFDTAIDDIRRDNRRGRRN